MTLMSRCQRWLRSVIASTCCLLLVLGFHTGNAMAESPQDSSASPTIMWGAWTGSDPLNPQSIDAFTASAGKHPSILHWGQPWLKGKTFVPFRPADLDSVRSRGAVPLLDWGSWDYSLGINQPNFALANISNGNYDAF